MEVDAKAVQEKEVNLMMDVHFFDFSKHYWDSLITLHKSWLDLLEAYCNLALSYESDRLTVLSGLASLWKSRGAGTYLASLWQDNILDSMMWKPRHEERIHAWKTYRASSWSPFALGYTIDDQKPASAMFDFLNDWQGISNAYAKVVDAWCIPDGEDKMGAVKDGYVLLRTLVIEVSSRNAPEYTFHWDRGIEN
jgi:hypothetical protein